MRLLSAIAATVLPSLVIGAPRRDVGGATDQGTACVFDRLPTDDGFGDGFERAPRDGGRRARQAEWSR